MEDKLSRQMQEALLSLQPDDMFMVQCAIKNLYKQKDTLKTTARLFERLEKHLAGFGTVIKVEVPELSFDTEDLISEENYNNINANDFLVELLSLNDEKWTLFGERENLDITFRNEPKPIEKNTDFEIIFGTLTQLMRIYHTIDEAKFKLLVKELPSIMQQVGAHDGNHIHVQIRFSKKQFEAFNNKKNFRLYLSEDKTEPVYLNFEQAKVTKEKVIMQECNSRLGKVAINIENFQLGVFTDQSKYQLSDKPETIALKFVFDYYFDYKILRDKVQSTLCQLFFHSEDSKFQTKLEIIIGIGGYFLLKMEIDLMYVQYAIMEQLADKSVIYIKLLSPPIYSVSGNNKQKHEKTQVKTDWTRVDNIFINKLDIVDRLILINNSVLKLCIPDSPMNINLLSQLRIKLEFYRLLQDKIDIALDAKEFKSGTGMIEAVTSLDFDIKYYILAVLGQNRFSTTNALKKLMQWLKNKLQGQKVNNKIIEAAFQSLIRRTNSVNHTLTINYNNDRNLSIFAEEYKKAQEELLDGLSQSDKRIAQIRRIALTPSGVVYHLALPEQTSSILRQYYDKLDNFLRVNFEDENQVPINALPYICTMQFTQLLNTEGVIIFNRKFTLFTWSASQLRTSQCWVVDYDSLKKSRTEMIKEIGQFMNLKAGDTAKNAARLGQNLSSSRQYIFKSNINIDIIEDSKDENGKLYTDGIGCISEDLIQEIRESLGNLEIMAIQIRYHGAKGVLCIKRGIPAYTIQLRPSMIKFDPVNGYGNSIDILDYNKFRGGYLNRQIILLLSTLGIEDQIFLDLLADYMKNIEELSFIDSSIYRYFNVDYNAEFEGIPAITTNLTKLMSVGQNKENNFFVGGILSRLKRRALLLLRTKANILVEKAARVIGLIDEYRILGENEVYCVVEGKALSGEIILTRNPCLHPGDIRKVFAVSKNEIQQRCSKDSESPFYDYNNCVVFPQNGPSIPAQTAGGDLDGDIYFISWDPKLIPEKVQEPMKYDMDAPKKLNKAKNLDELFPVKEMLEFMFEYMNSDVLGKIDNSHLAIADQSELKANDERCLQLAEMHSSAVDYVKHGQKSTIPKNLAAKRWPDFMEKKNQNNNYISTSVLGQLYRHIVEICASDLDNQPFYLQGFQCEKLPPIDTNIIYDYDQTTCQSQHLEQRNRKNNQSNSEGGQESGNRNNDQSNSEGGQEYICQKQDLEQESEIFEVEDFQIQPKDPFSGQNIAIKPSVIKYIDRTFVPHINTVCRAIIHTFKTIDGLKRLYGIQHEYEIYSGNYTNFTRGETKAKVNVENVQKRVIQHLVVLKHELSEILGKEDFLQKISLLTIIMSFSSKSHPYDVKSRLGQFFYYLYVKLNEDESFVRLKTKFMIWYRGFPWFYFIDEIDTLMKTNSKFRQDESHDINEIQSKNNNSSINQSQGASILQQSDIQSSHGTGVTKDTNDDLI